MNHQFKSLRSSVLLYLSIFLFTYSCSKDSNNVVIPTPELTEYQQTVIDYFKEVALGFEFGNASRITRKWNSNMKIFVGGMPSPAILDELDSIVTEINALVTDGFQMEVVSNQNLSNYYIFLGGSAGYVALYPGQSNLVNSNWGLFTVFWGSSQHLNSGHMYVDTERADLMAQKHLLREELTQSLGLANDSKKFSESIFQSDWTTTNSYASIDRELIRLLYHPDVEVGLGATQIESVLTDILLNE